LFKDPDCRQSPRAFHWAEVKHFDPNQIKAIPFAPDQLYQSSQTGSILIQNISGIHMARPTIKDLAIAADVSVATVNRVLAGAEGIRQATREKVQAAAEFIGFYGLGAIQSRNSAMRPTYRIGVLLPSCNRFHRSRD
jgi:Bacterial regulatory proteins, lacI family